MLTVNKHLCKHTSLIRIGIKSIYYCLLMLNDQIDKYYEVLSSRGEMNK